MGHQHLRVNIQLLPELKEAIGDAARARGESVSEFLRRGAEERLKRLREDEQRQQMAEGYRQMAKEHRSVAADWTAADLDGWDS